MYICHDVSYRDTLVVGGDDATTVTYDGRLYGANVSGLMDFLWATFKS